MSDERISTLSPLSQHKPWWSFSNVYWFIYISPFYSISIWNVKCIRAVCCYSNDNCLALFILFSYFFSYVVWCISNPRVFLQQFDLSLLLPVNIGIRANPVGQFSALFFQRPVLLCWAFSWKWVSPVGKDYQGRVLLYSTCWNQGYTLENIYKYLGQAPVDPIRAEIHLCEKTKRGNKCLCASGCWEKT